MKRMTDALDTLKAIRRLSAIAAMAGWALLTAPAAHATQAPASNDPPPGMSDDDVKMVVPGGEAMNYWTRWRGPSGQGIVEGGGYPEKWSDTENVMWKVEVPGRGHSSPIIWGDKLFLTTAREEGNRRSILCFSRTDGRLLWETDAPRHATEGRIYPKNSFASGTVSTDGERVYAWFANFGLIAVDMEGEPVWQVDFGPIALYHGPGGSPLLYDDRIILYQEQRSMGRGGGGAPSDGFIAAVDKVSGDILWQKARSPRPGWGTPVAVQVGDRVEIIVNGSRRVDAYDPATGELLWYCNGMTSEVIPTPVVGHGMVYCLSGRAGPTLAIQPGGRGDVTGTRLVWDERAGSSFVPSPLLVGDYLYSVNDMASTARVFNARTGEKVGSTIRMGQMRREGFSASPLLVNGKIFFTNDYGETFVLSQAPEFELLHMNSLGEQTLATPALVDGKWYFRTEKNLICIGSADGR